MAYLRLQDYFQQIQSGQLDQITGGDASIRLAAEYKALEEVTSYLTQKYDMPQELTDTLLWSNSISYKAKNRVYIDATAYSAVSAYAIGALTLESGNIYRCNTTIISPGEAFNLSHWTLIGTQYSLFFVTLPNPEFDYKKVYITGDVIFWKDKVYTALLPSVSYGHSQQLQYVEYQNLPPINVFPDNTINGAKYWGTGIAYSVAAATLPTDTTKWTAGDNRSQKIVEALIDAAIYKMLSRVQPNNIPQIRIDNYDAAILWLKACAKGTVTANIPVIQPKQGRRVRYGGPIKNQNSY